MVSFYWLYGMTVNLKCMLRIVLVQLVSEVIMKDFTLNDIKDNIASYLESKGLWRRAARRWLELLYLEYDVVQAEKIRKRIIYCIRMQKVENKSILFSKNDRRHLDARAKKLKCGSVSRCWIEDYF